MSVLGRGIGGYSMPYDRKQQLPPVEKLFGSIPSAPAQAPGLDFGNIDIDAIRQQIADSGFDFTNLFGMPAQQQKLPDMSGKFTDISDNFVDSNKFLEDRGYGPGITVNPDFMDRENFAQQKLPDMIPQVPNGSDFSIENLNLPDFSNFVTQQDLPVYNQPDLSQFITQQDLPAFNPKDYRDDFLSIAREGIEMPSYEQPDLSSFAKLTDIPTFDPSGLQKQIGGLEQQIAGMPQFNPQDYRDDFLSIAREGIEMPSYQAPDLSGYDTRLADLEKTLLSLQQPVANDRFSVNQLNPRGLF
jgi:hypothetical protein